MKVIQDDIRKLDSTEKQDSNFGNLCMKKGGSFQKERFSFILQSLMGGEFDPRTPTLPRAYATGNGHSGKEMKLKSKPWITKR